MAAIIMALLIFLLTLSPDVCHNPHEVLLGNHYHWQHTIVNMVSASANYS